MMSGNGRHGSMDLPRNDSKMSMILYFKNCGISELLSSLQINMLLCYHTFIDAGRRHGSPGSEKKDIISLFQATQKTVSQPPQPPISTELKQSWAQVDVAHSGLVSQLRVLSLENHNLKKEMTANLSSLFQEGDIISFKLVCKQTCLQLGRRTPFLSFKAVCYTNILGIQSRTKADMCRCVIGNSLPIKAPHITSS